MGLRINQNVTAMNAYRNLSVTEGQLSKSLERLSSGFRINRAADDAAGLAISEKLRGQVNGLNQASANAQNGISLIQTAEGALNETHAILQRMRTLAVQSANDTNTDEDRGQIQKEVDALTQELDRIADNTTFNGQKLLNGDFTGKKLHIGANAGENLSVTIGNMDAGSLGVTGAEKALSTNNAEGTIAGTVLKGTFTVDGTDVKNSLGQVVGSYVAADQEVTFSSGSATGTVTFNKDVDGHSFTVSEAVDVSTQAGADAAVATLDLALNAVSSQRADLGAVQNRLEHTIANLGVAAENLAASESRIRDTDMAAEMMKFTRAQILSQAGTAMLAQANQVPQGVLQLLR
jgi:flagellin